MIADQGAMIVVHVAMIGDRVGMIAVRDAMVRGKIDRDDRLKNQTSPARSSRRTRFLTDNAQGACSLGLVACPAPSPWRVSSPPWQGGAGGELRRGRFGARF